MKVIFNSDVLYSFATVVHKNHVPCSLRRFFNEFARLGVVIVLPLTTLLELERIQNKYILEERERLRIAYERLRRWGIPCTPLEPAQVIKKIDLVKYIKKFGLKVEIEEPSYDDFNDAHKRACLHLNPSLRKHDDKKKLAPDEMRDLIIWVLAIRIAKNEKEGVILISRDKIHNNKNGKKEADSVNLSVVKNFDDALELLSKLSPKEKIIKNLLTPALKNLEVAKLYVDQNKPYHVIAKSFMNNERGIVNIKGVAEIPLQDGNSLEADVEISIINGVVETLDLNNIKVDGKLWKPNKITITIKIPYRYEHENDYLERYEALKEVIFSGGGNES